MGPKALVLAVAGPSLVYVPIPFIWEAEPHSEARLEQVNGPEDY